MIRFFLQYFLILPAKLENWQMLMAWCLFTWTMCMILLKVKILVKMRLKILKEVFEVLSLGMPTRFLNNGKYCPPREGFVSRHVESHLRFIKGNVWPYVDVRLPTKRRRECLTLHEVQTVDLLSTSPEMTFRKLLLESLLNSNNSIRIK